MQGPDEASRVYRDTDQSLRAWKTVGYGNVSAFLCVRRHPVLLA